MGIDLQKEIKLSDLFRKRAASPPAEPEPKSETNGGPEPEKKGGGLFARKPKEPREPKAKRAAKAGPALPATPLMRAFDLLPRDEVREKKKGGLGLAQVLVALVGLLVFAGLAGGYLLMSARVGDKQSQVDDLRAQLSAQQVPSQPDPQTGAAPSLAGESQPRTAALADALSTRIAWDRILREFSLVLPSGVSLTTLTAGAPPAGSTTTPPPSGSTSGSSFTIGGFARSQEGVALLLSRLEVIPEFSSVQLQSSDGSEGAGFVFTIAATLAQAGATS